jgi:hypothetical protein
VVPAAGPGAEQVAAEVPGRQADEQAEDEDEAVVGADELGGRDGARVRRDEGVHDGEAPATGSPVGQQRAARAPRDVKTIGRKTTSPASKKIGKPNSSAATPRASGRAARRSGG